VLSQALRSVNGEVSRLPRHATSFLASACDWDRDTLVGAVSYSIDRLGSSPDPDVSALATGLAEGLVDRWLAADSDGAGFRAVRGLGRRADVIMSPVELAFGSELRSAVDAGRLATWSRDLRDLLGVPLPDIRLLDGEVDANDAEPQPQGRPDPRLAFEAELRLHGQRVSRNAFYPDRVRVPKLRWEALGKPLPADVIQNFEKAEEDALWMPLPVLTATGYGSTIQDFDETVVSWLEYHCRRAFGLLFDGGLLMAFVREVLSAPGGRRRIQDIPLRQLRQVVVDLVEEGVPFGLRRDAMLEELTQLTQRIEQPELLTGKLREFLSVDICSSVVDASGQVTTILLDLQLEEALANRVEVDHGRFVLRLDPPDAIKLDSAVHRHVKRIAEKADGPAPVLVTVPPLRESLARLLHRFDPRLPVLSFTELERDLAPVPGGVVNVALDLGTTS
jgi:hypothetical protein